MGHYWKMVFHLLFEKREKNVLTKPLFGGILAERPQEGRSGGGKSGKKFFLKSENFLLTSVPPRATIYKLPPERGGGDVP